MVFVDSKRDGGRFPEDSNLEEARVDRVGEIGYLFQLEERFSTRNRTFIKLPYEVVGLPNFIRSFLQSPLRSINPPIALIDVLLHISHVVVLEAILALLGRGFVLGLERFAVDLGAGPEVLLGVREKVMRTCADKIRATDLWVGKRELSMSRGGTGTHKLLCEGIC